MFETFTTKQPGRGKRLSVLLFASLVFHSAVLGGIVVWDQLQVEVVPKPPILLTFVDFSALPPPPPPPPPPKKRKTETKPEPKIEAPKVKLDKFVAPAEIPQDKPREPEEPELGEDDGVEGGVEGGVVGGVVGGVIGGMMDTPPPPPPPPPQAPVYQPPEVIKKKRIAGIDPVYPRIARTAGIEATVILKIFITPEGTVGDYKILQTDSRFEKAVLDAIATWKFTPHTINNRPVGVYTVYKFVFKLQQ